jgi:hypothetical protein
MMPDSGITFSWVRGVVDDGLADWQMLRMDQISTAQQSQSSSRDSDPHCSRLLVTGEFRTQLSWEAFTFRVCSELSLQISFSLRYSVYINYRVRVRSCTKRAIKTAPTTDAAVRVSVVTKGPA